MPRNPYRITVTGVIMSSALGVYLSTVPLGLVAMIAVAPRTPALLLAVPFYAAAGALAGVLADWFTRAARPSGRSRRRRRFAIAGAVTMPCAIFVGQLDVIIRDGATGPRLGALVFCCGAAAIMTYYLIRRTTTLRTRQQQAEATQARKQARAAAYH